MLYPRTLDNKLLTDFCRSFTHRTGITPNTSCLFPVHCRAFNLRCHFKAPQFRLARRIYRVSTHAV
ncbi:unknown [Prevotella sp. CAG:1031]|nr:unknown [Prevotella sp. CAG:1031]